MELGPVLLVEEFDKKSTHVAEAPQEIRDTVHAHRQRLRRSVLDVAPLYEDNLDTKKINAFYERQGLRPAPAALINPEDIPNLRAKLAGIGFSDPILEGLGTEMAAGVTDEAAYFPQFDLIVAVKWPNAVDSPEGRGRFLFQLAHEKAHSTSSYNGISCRRQPNGGISYSSQRVGQALAAKHGIFLEEGFADLMAADFIRNELGLTNGAWSDNYFRSLGENPLLPGVYIWPVANGGWSSISSYAAYGLELLRQRNPDVHNGLIMARNSVQGLREVAQAIEAVRPGLYSELCSLQRAPNDFIKGFRQIQAALQNT